MSIWNVIKILLLMPLLAPAIAAGGAIAGGVIDAFTQSAQNRKSRMFSREMYDLQKQDNLAFWAMQNEYNSPQSQMRRLQEAGLNPNLVYGSGSAVQSAGPVRSPDVQAAQFRASSLGQSISQGAMAFAQYQDYEAKKLQNDNLRLDATVKLEQAALIDAQRRSTEAGTSRSIYDLAFQQEHRQVYSDALRENLRQVKAQIDATVTQTETLVASTASNLAEAAQRILNMRAQALHTQADRSRIFATIQNLKSDTRLKDADYELRRLGVYPGDAAWVRYVVMFLQDYLKDLPKPADVLKPPAWFNKGLFLGGPFNRSEFPFYIKK